MNIRGDIELKLKLELGATYQSALCCLYSRRPILINVKGKAEEIKSLDLKETSRGVS